MDKMYDTLYIANNLVGVAVTLLRTLKRKQKSRNVLRRRWSKMATTTRPSPKDEGESELARKP